MTTAVLVAVLVAVAVAGRVLRRAVLRYRGAQLVGLLARE